MEQNNCEPTCPPSIVFADHVVREQGTGKLSLIGTFQRMSVPRFPFVSPPFNVIVSIQNFDGIVEHLQVTVRIEEKSSGHVVCSAGAEVATKRPFKRNDIVEIPFGLPPTQFPNAGIYDVVLLANNDVIAKRDLPIYPLTATEPQQQ